MARIFAAMLLLTGCTTSSREIKAGPSSPPGEISTGTPGNSSPEEPPPPSPADWFKIYLHPDHRQPSPDYPPWFGYRSSKPTMRVTFHNVGTEPLTTPTVKFGLEQRDEELGDELLTYFAGAAGDDWSCAGSRSSIACASSAEAVPGEALPVIEIEMRPLNPESGPRIPTHFTAAFGDVLYDAEVYYDTSI